MTRWLRNKRGMIGIALFSLATALLVASHLTIWFGSILPEAEQIVTAGSKVMQENKDQSMPTFVLWTRTKDLGMNMGVTFLLSSASLLLSLILATCGFWAAYHREGNPPNQPLQRNASTGPVSSFESPARRG